MIQHNYKELYNQDSVRKDILIKFENNQEVLGIAYLADEKGFVLLEESDLALVEEYSVKEITNDILYSEAFKIEESLCSENQLKFGCCEASQLYFKIANVTGSMKGLWLTVTQTLNGDIQTPFRFGKYKVFSDVPSADRNYREVIAYDVMYDIATADVTEWYHNLEFPMTQKAFRDSFFNYLGVTQQSISLIHDGMTIEKTITAEIISGKEIICSICELNGVFGHINRDDNFEYISLNSNNSPIEIETKYIKSGEYEDFYTETITKIQIRQEENDIGSIYGEGDNCYIVEDNFLVYGKSSEELDSICQKLFNKIVNISYRPFKGVIRGNPCYMVGDYIRLQTRNAAIKSFILERTITGIHSLMDDLRANGVIKYSEDINAYNKEIIRLKGKTNVLKRTIDETRSEITNMETGLKSLIQQTAENVKIEVKADLEVGSVNLLRESQTLNFEDYYFQNN